MKKIISGLLVFIMLLSMVAFSGCSEDVPSNKDAAEDALMVYFSALCGFNLNAMKVCVEGEDEGDVGFPTESFSYDYAQTSIYKIRVKDMYRALSNTINITIDSSEEIGDDKVAFDITLKHADVEEEAMTAYTNSKVDEYIELNPYFLAMNEVQQNDTAMTVIAEAYEEYLQITEKLERKFKIAMSKESGDWKIHTKDNKEFFDFLAVLFG